jgi:hypothetical protein
MKEYPSVLSLAQRYPYRGNFSPCFLPKSLRDILLLWSHGLGTARGAGHAILNGITLLPKRPH